MSPERTYPNKKMNPTYSLRLIFIVAPTMQIELPFRQCLAPEAHSHVTGQVEPENSGINAGTGSLSGNEI
jgi:hypothetical protein